MTKQIFVQEYTRADGTKVRSHYRNIEETANMLSQGNSQGALDLINQTLSTIPEEKNALAQLFSEGDLTPDEKTTLMEQLQYLQSFQNEAGRYQSLASNNLDTTSAADRIKEMFSGQPTGAAAESYNNDTLAHKLSFPDEYNHPDIRGNKLTFKENAEKYLMQTLFAKSLPLATEALRNGFNDLRPARDLENTYVLEDRSKVKNKHIQDFLIKEGVQPYDKGIVYSFDSPVSKKLANAPEIDDFLDKNLDKIKNNKFEKDTISFNKKFGVKNLDNHLGYHNVTVLNATTDNNNAYITLGEYFDFKREKSNGQYDFINNANNDAYVMQQKGHLKNYYSLIFIQKKINKH